MTEHELFLAHMRYEEETGKIFWRKARRGRQLSKEAGCLGRTHGYHLVVFNYKTYRRGRLVWFLKTGKWPEKEIDHINRNKTDDRFENLRDVTSAINTRNRGMQSNNTSGLTGIRWHRGGYEVCLDKQYLGRFLRLERAISVRQQAIEASKANGLR